MRKTLRLLSMVTVLGLAAIPAAYAGTLYAVSGSGNAASVLYILDSTTGGVLQTVGATGFSHVTGLAINPTTGQMYGQVSDAFGSGGTQLLSIDKNTGAGTVIGSTGEQIPDMTFNAAGVLFAWSESGANGNDYLITLNLATGAPSFIGTNNVSTSNTGLAFDRNGILWLKPGGSLYTLNTTTGIGTFVEGLSGSPQNALAFDQNNVAFTVTRNGSNSTLQTIDIGTGNVNTVGSIGVGSISALAFDLGAPVPEPGTLSLAGLAFGGLALTLRKRRNA